MCRSESFATRPLARPGRPGQPETRSTRHALPRPLHAPTANPDHAPIRKSSGDYRALHLGFGLWRSELDRGGGHRVVEIIALGPAVFRGPCQMISSRIVTRRASLRRFRSRGSLLTMMSSRAAAPTTTAASTTSDVPPVPHAAPADRARGSSNGSMRHPDNTRDI